MFFLSYQIYLQPKHTTESSADTVEQSTFKDDIHYCESLPHHVNTARVLTHFSDSIPGAVINQPCCDICEVTVAITDQVHLETVAEFVDRTASEHEDSPDRYEKKVSILLLQILSGVEHLAQVGIAHRDLRPENIVLLDEEELVITNFTHAVEDSNNRSDFSGNVEHSPPEIVSAAVNPAALDYKKCDSFAVGCIAYELLHRKNPFAANVALVQLDYNVSELPVMCSKSRYSKGLGTLARHLLRRDPTARMSAAEGIQLMQVLLWGPDSLDEECLESSAGDWLETERARTVARIARSQMHYDRRSRGHLETFLKCQFLFDATEDSLVKYYKMLQDA